jgi:phosphate transport system substrate-binding protein
LFQILVQLLDSTVPEGKYMHIQSRYVRFIKALTAALLLNSKVFSAALSETTVRIGGTGSGLGVMKILAEAFEKSHTGIKIKVLPNLGSSGGIKALLNGALDVAISARALKEEEAHGGAVAAECARTPFVIIANNSVSKSDITTDELEMIYSGKLQKWPDGTRIRLILRPPGDTDTSIVMSISGPMETAVKAALDRHDLVRAVTDQEAVDAVKQIPGAVGCSTLTQIISEHRQVKVLTLNGVKASPATLASQHYPLAKPLYLVTTPATPPAALQFIKFVRSPRGSALLAAAGAHPFDNGLRVK